MPPCEEDICLREVWKRPANTSINTVAGMQHAQILRFAPFLSQRLQFRNNLTSSDLDTVWYEIKLVHMCSVLVIL